MRPYKLFALAVSGVAGLFLAEEARAQTQCVTPVGAAECVRTPAPRVIVEMSRPQVVVNEVDDHEPPKEKRWLFKHGCQPKKAVRETRPVVGMVLAPVHTLGYGGLSAPSCGGEDRERRTNRLGGLALAYEMDLQNATHSAARAAEEEELKASLSALERVGSSLRAQLGASRTRAAPYGTEPSEAADVNAKIKEFSIRIDRLEELILKHDDYLRKQIKPGS